MKSFGIRTGTTGPESARIAPAPDYIDAAVLAASTNKAHTVPTNARWVIFSADGDFYAKPNTAAAVPGADVTDGSGSQLNPSACELPMDNSITSINLIASATRVVTMAFYK